jgi:hypothetical protein
MALRVGAAAFLLPPTRVYSEPSPIGLHGNWLTGDT